MVLIECLRAMGPMRRDRLAEACQLSGADLTRALKSARQMGVVAHIPQDDETPRAECPLGLTGRALPAARRVPTRESDTSPHFQPLLDAWGIARPSGHRGKRSSHPLRHSSKDH